MSLVSVIAGMLKSGKVIITSNNSDPLEIKVANKQIDVNSINKDFIKQTLTAARGEKNRDLHQSIMQTVIQIKYARKTLGMLKVVAEELSNAGITVTLSYKGDIVATMGSKANPKLSSLATGTKAIEINSPKKLFELGF